MPLIEEPKPKKKRAASKNLEAKLQADIVVEFSQRFPSERGRLWGNFSTVESAIEGAQKNSVGLIRGLPDLMYLPPSCLLVGAELKYPGSYHDCDHLREQAEWLLNFPHRGAFIHSKQMFFDFISGASNGITPKQVLERIKNVKTSTICWDFDEL